MSIKWDGLDEMMARMDKTEKAAFILGTALFQEGENIMTKAKMQTPVDTGALRSSGYVFWPELRRTGASVTLGFGTDYAIYVHEGTRNMNGKKYLEGPVKAAASGFANRLKARIRRGIL